MQHNVFATDQQGTAAVKKLRQHKLHNGLPFMINAKELRSNECYLEYPDGFIKLVVHVAGTQEMHVVRELTVVEAASLRDRFQFSFDN